MLMLLATIALLNKIQTSKFRNHFFLQTYTSQKNRNISYKTYKKVPILTIRTTKTLIQTLFFDNYKIFGNSSKAIVE